MLAWSIYHIHAVKRIWQDTVLSFRILFTTKDEWDEFLWNGYHGTDAYCKKKLRTNTKSAKPFCFGPVIHTVVKPLDRTQNWPPNYSDVNGTTRGFGIGSTASPRTSMESPKRPSHGMIQSDLTLWHAQRGAEAAFDKMSRVGNEPVRRSVWTYIDNLIMMIKGKRRVEGPETVFVVLAWLGWLGLS